MSIRPSLHRCTVGIVILFLSSWVLAGCSLSSTAAVSDAGARLPDWIETSITITWTHSDRISYVRQGIRCFPDDVRLSVPVYTSRLSRDGFSLCQSLQFVELPEWAYVAAIPLPVGSPESRVYSFRRIPAGSLSSWMEATSALTSTSPPLSMFAIE